MKSVRIAGGGLAGLSLGVALRRRGVPVTVVEAGQYPRHRVGGEFISGVSQEELAGLGIDDLLADAPRHRSTAWFDGETALLRAELPEPAMGMSRFCLDLRLAERLRALGGKLVTGQREGAPAFGMGAGVVMAVGRPRRASAWLGLKAHYHGLPLVAALEVHVSDSCYVGLTPVEDGRVNVCGLFHQGGGAVEAGERRLLLARAVRAAGLRALGERLEQGTVDEASIKGVNQFLLGWQPRPRAEELRIGDQAAMIPPFTGNGMSMAFQSALEAVEPLVGWSEGAQSWEAAVAAVRRRHRRRFAARLRWSWLLHGLLLSGVARQVSLGLVRQGWLPFETIYRRLR
jgi:2-polyprenyl-6-methoxyphenol hydroxylase-like FAD-dependent oxidoreductase